MGIVVKRDVGRLRTFQSRLRVARAFAMGTLAHERLDGQSFSNGGLSSSSAGLKPADAEYPPLRPEPPRHHAPRRYLRNTKATALTPGVSESSSP